MTGPYLDALHRLDAARAAHRGALRAAERTVAGRRAATDALDAALEEQEGRLRALAAAAGTPLADDALAPAPDVSGALATWGAATRDGEDAVARAERSLETAGRVARLPQLLPDWSSDLARAAAVYAALALPNAVLTVLLSLVGTSSSSAGLAFEVLVVPAAVTAIGAWFLARHAGPRVPADPPARRRYHLWLGVLLALASWLLVGSLLDVLHP